MTKGELVTAVQKGCDCGCDLSKKAIEGIIDTTFENIVKAIKKNKRFSYPDLEGVEEVVINRDVAEEGVRPLYIYADRQKDDLDNSA